MFSTAWCFHFGKRGAQDVSAARGALGSCARIAVAGGALMMMGRARGAGVKAAHDTGGERVDVLEHRDEVHGVRDEAAANFQTTTQLAAKDGAQAWAAGDATGKARRGVIDRRAV